MNDLVKELAARGEALGEEIRSLAALDERTPEQEQRLEEASREYDEVRSQYDVELGKAQVLADQEARHWAYNSTEVRKSRTERAYGREVTAYTKANALRAWMAPGEARDEWHQDAKRMGVNVNSKELEMRMGFNSDPFSLYDQIWSGQSVFRSVSARWEKRQQGTSPDAAGGFTVPEGMMQAIEIALLQFGGMRMASEVVRTDNGREVPWPTVNDTDQVGEIIAENAAMNQQDVTFGQATTKPFMYTSKYVPVSIQLIQDSATSAVCWVNASAESRILTSPWELDRGNLAASRLTLSRLVSNSRPASHRPMTT